MQRYITAVIKSFSSACLERHVISAAVPRDFVDVTFSAEFVDASIRKSVQSSSATARAEYKPIIDALPVEMLVGVVWWLYEALIWDTFGLYNQLKR